MSGEQLNTLKERLATLTPREKLELAKFLEAQAAADLGTISEPRNGGESSTESREQHMRWLKAHREEYAGQYVALDGDRLVGNGTTIREAREQALQHGVERPFLTHVSSASDAPFGGW